MSVRYSCLFCIHNVILLLIVLKDSVSVTCLDQLWSDTTVSHFDACATCGRRWFMTWTTASIRMPSIGCRYMGVQLTSGTT